MRIADDFRTKWGVVAAMLVVGLAVTWLENPPGRALGGVFERLALLVMFTLPPGLAVAVVDARFGSRSRVAYAAAWTGACFLGMWLSGLAILMSLLAENVVYCEGRACDTTLATRVWVAAVAGLVVASCVFVESRLRKRWGASEPS